MKPERGSGESLSGYISRLETWSMSPEGREAERARLAAFAEQERLGLREWLLKTAEVPLDTVNVIGDECRETPHLKAIKESRGQKIVVLAGDIGMGKTVAACWELAEPRVKTGLFVRSVRMARWDRYDEEQMARLLDPQLLVIDDLGLEFNDAKGNFLTILDEVVVDRSENGRRTVITTNLNVPQFKDVYGERILDRIRKYGSFYEFGGESLRRA